MELKKLQKMKEFKPNMVLSFPLFYPIFDLWMTFLTLFLSSSGFPNGSAGQEREEEEEGHPRLTSYGAKINGMSICSSQEADKEKETKKTKKEKDPLKPKQPMSAFFLFSNERRAALLEETKNILEVAKITGEEWKNMTDEQRGPYEEMAKKKKEKYMQEMEVYKQRKEEEAESVRKEEEEMMKLQKQEALQLLKKKEKTENIIKKTKEERQKKKKKQQRSDPNKPKKPASSFLLYSKEARKTLMQETPGLNKQLHEKNVWNGKAADAMEAYKKEMEEYNKSAAAAAAENK
ncbi:hypothetical protein V6N11_047297 [Hibiscus sabdariffa]|uniref:Uncharacterized protein n=2 Tax=Hibiscus sabdariffa TaxID=183260 RepID=A0ABR1ZL51_9ROSI